MKPAPPRLIEAIGLGKQYRIGSRSISVLESVDFCVRKGEFVAIMGPSGSGKSTLLHILGCLDRPSAGGYQFDGRNVLEASDRELSHIRANHIGFIFQTFNLVPTLNVYENVELPFVYAAIGTAQARRRIDAAIDQVGLGPRVKHKPSELSGGEMQRVAIARAIAVAPKLILADEPTGNLDSATGREILEIFGDLHHRGATIVLVTHDRDVAAVAQRRVHLVDGGII